MSNECQTNQPQGSCGTQQQHAAKEGSDCCQVTEKLICLADKAWEEVLKEKMKEQIEKQHGAKLSKLAELVTEANHRRWAHKIEAKKGCHDFQEKVKAAMFDLIQD